MVLGRVRKGGARESEVVLGRVRKGSGARESEEGWC